MDFTSYPQISSLTVSKVAPAERSRAKINTLQNDASSPPSAAYETNDLTYPGLMIIESDVPSLVASRTSSVVAASLPASEPESAATSMRQSSLPGSLPEKLCPLIAGEIDSCQPSRCGPDAPCMNFTNLPPIEECNSIPCISPSTSDTKDLTTATMRRPLHLSSRRRNVRSTASGPSPTRITTSVSVSEPQSTTRRGKQQPTKEGNRTRSKVEAKQRAKAAHSLVEKKYRENLNTQLAMLHTTIQNAYYGPRRAEAEPEFDFDTEIDPYSLPVNGSTKFRKSEVLSDAMNYINQTEVEMRHMENEIQRLTDRVRTLEACRV